jgi:asparaginyl-tRNA synthetase
MASIFLNRTCGFQNGRIFVQSMLKTKLFSIHSDSKNDPSFSTFPKYKIKKLLDSTAEFIDTEVKVQGWVRTVRAQKKFSFIEVNDGSILSGIQAVADSEIASYSVIESLSTGSSVEILGTVIKSQGKGQACEIKVTDIKLIGSCPEDYPLQKKRHSTEFLRSIAHLRTRTNTMSAVSRVRSALAFATHQFFHNEGFVYLQSPLITTSDCEGAGEMFRVTTLPLDNIL